MKILFHKLQFRTVAVLTVLLPLSGFISCVGWSVIYNFQSSTATHCGVTNYLPSVSAAIGDYIPQRYIWRTVIALHTLPRIKFAIAHYLHYLSILAKRTKNLVLFNCIANLIEIASLFGLTFVSSTDNYTYHKIFFITFLISSTFYMSLSVYLLGKNRIVTANAREAKSFSYKKRLLITTFVAIVGSLYFFARHNTYCEPLMYTWFAVCEYLVILCNMAFHMTAYFDFHTVEWEWSLWPSPKYQSRI